jgi:hypothetical protein
MYLLYCLRVIILKYNSIVSLGFFCSVAINLEEMGFRSTSGPFDWLISSWNGVEQLIENNFSDFLDEKYLYQIREEKYKNIKYDVDFYHDFDRYANLSSQLSSVIEKYEKRIDTFYETIREPTLFIRYIKDNKEFEYHSEKYGHVQKLLKKYNANNDIIFIMNGSYQETSFPCYFVEIDENDIVNRNPLITNLELKDLLLRSYEQEQLQKNLEFYRQKQRKSTKAFRLRKGLRRKVKKVFLKPYVHDKKID